MLENRKCMVTYGKQPPRPATILKCYFRGTETVVDVVYEDGSIEKELYMDWIKLPQ